MIVDHLQSKENRIAAHQARIDDARQEEGLGNFCSSCGTTKTPRWIAGQCRKCYANGRYRLRRLAQGHAVRAWNRIEGDCHCGKPLLSKGLCRAHYNRLWYLKRHPNSKSPAKEPYPCKTPGCLDRGRARGMCSRCYARWNYHDRKLRA